MKHGSARFVDRVSVSSLSACRAVMTDWRGETKVLLSHEERKYL
jgi:hypothetical protein